MEDYKSKKNALQNELLIRKMIKEHLDIKDEEQVKNMEKLFIYNLLN